MGATVNAAGFVLVRGEGEELEILLLRSSRDGFWGLPKGHLDGDEDPMNAACRELSEETGLNPKAVDISSEWSRAISYAVRGKPKQVDYFLGKTEESEVTLSEEHSEFAWVSEKEALDRLAFSNLKDVIRDALDFLS